MEKRHSCNVSKNNRMYLECQYKENIRMTQKQQACNVLTNNRLHLEHQSKKKHKHDAETTGL